MAIDEYWWDILVRLFTAVENSFFFRNKKKLICWSFILTACFNFKIHFLFDNIQRIVRQHQTINTAFYWLSYFTCFANFHVSKTHKPVKFFYSLYLHCKLLCNLKRFLCISWSVIIMESFADKEFSFLSSSCRKCRWHCWVCPLSVLLK